MSRFNSQNCPVCGLKFEDNDDIVVCPECGTPHHRSCYEANGGCANTDKHGAFEWQPVSEKTDEAEKIEKAETESEEESSIGGFVLPDGFSQSGMNVSREDMQKRRERAEKRDIDGVSEMELMNFFGGRGAYFVMIFRNMTTTGRKISFNVFAGILYPLYQFYRRMGVYGIILGAFQFMLNIPWLIAYFSNSALGESFIEALSINVDQLSSVATALGYVSFAMLVLVTLFNDYFYMKWATGKIKAIRAQYKEASQEYYVALSQSGTPSVLLMILGTLAVYVVGIAIMIGIMFLATGTTDLSAAAEATTAATAAGTAL